VKYDLTIIGAGIVGLASGYKLLMNNPGLKIAILDKEKGVASHQTGHNSGVIHSGIYYKPGSLKAINCQKGYRELLDFSKEFGIAHEVCGKVIVATKEEERARLDKIFKSGIANGMKGLRKILPEEVKEIEPHVRNVEAIWVPQAGIIDYKKVAEKYSELIEEKGGKLFLGEKVTAIFQSEGRVRVQTEKLEIDSKIAVNCAGLQSDKVAALTEKHLNVKILPFRGEYYELVAEKKYLVRNLIYPVPNPNFPFLGVHFTRMIKGGIEAGPNAVLAFKREGYSRWDFHPGELAEILAYPGFRKLAAKFWRTGLGEMHRSYSKRAFVNAVRHLIPTIGYDDLKRGGAGVRAQAVDCDGNLIDDYLIIENQGVINVLNAPSPAATSSLAIGSAIAEKVLKKLN